MQKYAAALTKGLAGESAHLIIEPGRFIVAQAGALLTRVLFVKKNGSKTFVITDAGMNDLIRPSLYHAHHEILPVKQPRAAAASMTADIVGPVCESGDFFARDRVLAGGEARRSGSASRRRSLRHEPHQQLQHASASGGSAGRRRRRSS